MPCASAISEHPLATHAAGEVIGQVLEAVGAEPDLAVLFVTGPFAGAMDDIANAVAELLRPRCFIGSTAVSVLAQNREVEETGAVVLFAASWGHRVRHGQRGLRTLSLRSRRVEEGWQVEGSASLEGAEGILLLLAEPRRFPIEEFLAELQNRNPGLTVLGGIASAPADLTADHLVVDDERVDSGAVGVVLPTGVPVRAVLSQGHRPVGDPFVVTAATGNRIEALGGRPALERIMEFADAVSPEDRLAMSRSLHVGIVVEERDADYGPGDFLVRDVFGADRSTGAVAVDAEVEVGTTVAFVVRDAESADEDLRRCLAGESVAGALVFTGADRGTRLFGQRHHDAESIGAHVGGHATAGMFSTGEIGPVAGRSFRHHRSTALLLFDD